MSASSPGCCGCQSSRARVRALEAGMSAPVNRPRKPKCSSASSGDFDTSGMSRRRAITSAIALNGTPSSAMAWKGPPSTPRSSARR